MKGYEYASYMTLEDWNNWESNILIKSDIDVLLNDYYDDFWELISSSFVWQISIEGELYWEKIAERKEPLTK